MEDNIKIGLY